MKPRLHFILVLLSGFQCQELQKVYSQGIESVEDLKKDLLQSLKKQI
jgi:hypothetical protein